MYKYYIIYKPYGVLSQFTDEGGHPGLGTFIDLQKDVYPVGRLDHDSEGLLLLTNDKRLNKQLLEPSQKHDRTYWAQVDHEVTAEAIEKLEKGVTISINGVTYQTMPAKAKIIDTPVLPERKVPVRVRKNIPTTWIELSLVEGKNRQVRKMTAAVGHPTLRLVRAALEDLELGSLQPGDMLELKQEFVYKRLKIK